MRSCIFWNGLHFLCHHFFFPWYLSWLPSTFAGTKFSNSKLCPSQQMRNKLSLNCSYFLEPIGGSGPKLSSLIPPLVHVQLSMSQSLSCPVQGSPIPSFRSVSLWTLWNRLSFRTNWQFCTKESKSYRTKS